MDRNRTLLVKRYSGFTDLSSLAGNNPQRYPFLLQSVAANAKLARYDLLFACPDATLEIKNGDLTGPGSEGAKGFLAALDNWWVQEGGHEFALPEEYANRSLPFTGGWFLYLGYELAAEVEPGLSLSIPADEPVAFATRIPVTVCCDRLSNETMVIAEPEAAADFAQVCAELAALEENDMNSSTGVAVSRIEEDEPEQFLTAVNAAKEYIRAGDIFQANLSRCWQANTSGPVDISGLYSALCETNPAPFAGMIRRDDFAVLSSSPERLIRRKDDKLSTRPIAGTRPRREAAGQADKVAAELLAHPKERAEHIMLIDLERNDLGRVSVGGSVEVDEYMVVESYSHVHHIVSNVTGRARDGLKPGELIRAVFPGGTITGCPKVRCMEIIHELEGRPRGAYTGSMGYLNLNGDCDLNILIRTMTVRNNVIELAAGSGIVADSEPQAELEESRAKAKGMILALQGQTD